MTTLLDTIKNKAKEQTQATQSTQETNSLISQNLIDLCNYRIQQEEYSARIYVAMSRWLDDRSYIGAAKLWMKYSQEELAHAEKFYTFLLGLGINPITPELDKPEQEFESLMQIVDLSYTHEVEIYRQCSELAWSALNEKNLLLYPLALAFTSEQVEELGKLQVWIDMFKSFGTEPITLLHIDEKMGEKAN